MINKYLVGFADLEILNNRRRELFIEIFGKRDGTTKYVTGYVKHPEIEMYAMEINGLLETKLTADELFNLKSYAELEIDGWFPKEEEIGEENV